MKIEKFEDLEIWTLSIEIGKNAEFLIQNTNLKTNYSLRNQINRSSGSIMDNIAEGLERNGNREFIIFFKHCKRFCRGSQISISQSLIKN